ncbi:hypothetical protein [Stappia indica]|uniref:hypothetical protein n=1 Tax=Stappia indica TaxID=538381 RepID=UPI001D17E9BD|nr:hypothetical protein [Stappia indica]MCC4246153.1 hypothetical protein [Stappia indica]
MSRRIQPLICFHCRHESPRAAARCLQCQQPLLPADRALQSRLMPRAGRVESAATRK